MKELTTISTSNSHGGVQGVYSHKSDVCNCDMTFAVFLPPQAEHKPCPVLWYLSGLTCSHANVMEKGEYRQAAAEHGIIIICPDTSPRGKDVPDDEGNWQFGSGAGFYLDATIEPWKKNYQMYSYIARELPELISANFNADMQRQSIFGHSMGGHGALTIALKNPECYKSCSAFAPIVQPSTADWSSSPLRRYLGENETAWREYDACHLIEDGNLFSPVLVDQGSGDDFLDNGLRPWLLEEVCNDKDIELTVRMQKDYDHSYFFISTFMAEHITWHARHLNNL
ncbi:MAG: S-formylglutathione hydrolase [Hyphomicrobiales bacterium]|nr:S-formylglutathione hydrolase [Hyphomicrobiales bacterium]